MYFKKFAIVIVQMGEPIFEGGTTRNHLKEWFKNQKQPNHFLGPFILNVFKTINFFSCLSIACTNIWLEVYFGI
jgi:hypothetical protein